MAQVFNLPTIGDAMSEGEIVEWLVAVGDEVQLDQPICSVETDKSVVELTSPYRGVVLSLGGAVGDVVPVGEPLIVVGGRDEVVDAALSPAGGDDTDGPTSQTDQRPGGESAVSPTVHSPLVRKLAAERAVDLNSVSGSGVGGRITRDDVLAAADVGAGPGSPTILAMPKIRKAARDRAIDLASSNLNGSGPRGSITLADLDRWHGSSVPAPLGDAPQAPPRRERLSAMRRSIAAHLAESARTIPQFTSNVEVDVSALLATRKALAGARDRSVPLDALLIRLLIPVLRDHPVINAMLDGADNGAAEEVVYFNHFDIGIAVDTPGGLMVPVIRQADRLSLDNLCDEVVRLATAARDRTIQPDDFGGQTFTVNNVGALGIVSGTPILPLGTSTIAAFGVARPVLRMSEGGPVEVPMMTISATFDHRLIDGGDSARFLGQLKRHLEVPALGLV